MCKTTAENKSRFSSELESDCRRNPAATNMGFVFHLYCEFYVFDLSGNWCRRQNW
jgi:hypothetical protein